MVLLCLTVELHLVSAVPKFTFIVTPEGKLPVGIASTLTARLKELAGKKCTIELLEAKDKRSLNANAFYWSVVLPIVRQFRLEQGDAVSIEQIHEDLLSEFAPLVESKLLDGAIKLVPKRSKNMNVEEFSNYLRAIEVRLNQFSIYLPVME